VEGIIRDVLLENGADDAENVRAVSIFQKSSREDDEIAGYVVEVKNVEQFLLSLGCLQFNASFRAVSGILQVTKTITGKSRIGSCTTVQAARVARIACAVNLEKISGLLCAAWAFSIALDTSTVEGTGYLDFRVRVCVKSEIENLHVLAIPLRDRHTGEVMFNAMADVLDKLCENWRENGIGVTNDGDRDMTRQVKGVASRIERETQTA
jgi:hypothetical protein